jgi:glycosyltransferase involved in cell wall biosynthesis
MPVRHRSTSDTRRNLSTAQLVNQVTQTLDIVIPVFNEADVLPEFHSQLQAVCDELSVHTRFIYVNDGSTDATTDVLRQLSDRDQRVVSVELTRNFGHQAALSAGLSIADADCVITMDGDGQHPPALIPALLHHISGDFDVVLTVRRTTNGSGIGKSLTSTLFYRILNWISATKLTSGAADFRALRREVVDSLKHMPEYHRFVRGMVSWLGYRTLAIEYDAPPRIAGSSKFSIGKMFKLAMDATFSFSLVPLQISVALGVLFFALAAAEALYVLSFWIRGEQHVLAPGWSSLMFMLLVVGGTLMTMLGVVGAYVGYILQEAKGRPVFVIRSIQSSHAHSARRTTARQADGIIPTREPADSA